MTSKDLMIGDWYAFRGHPYKCTASDIASIAECEEKGAPTDISEIPLTPEILEKNGFEKDPESGELIWTDDNVTEVVWVGTILTIRGEYANAEFATCMFVHELQHCLKLVGIEKEITL